MASAPPNSVTPSSSSGAGQVVDMITKIQAAKAQGRFTYQAGKVDRAINLVMAGLLLATLSGVGKGVHQLANNYGKKDM